MTVMPQRLPLVVSLAGEALPPGLARTLASALVRQVLNAPALAELAFAEAPPEPVPAIGDRLALAIGQRPLFDGEIVAISHECDAAHGRILRLQACDALHRLRKRQEVRALRDVTVADLAGRMAAGLGLEAAADWPGPQRRLVVQHDQSDLEWLVELAADAGLHVFLDDGILRLTTLAGSGDAIVLRLGAGLQEVRAGLSAESLRASTEAQGWNPARITPVRAQAPLARVDAAELRDSGLSVFTGLGKRILVNRLADSADEAEALAQADMDRAAALQATLEGVAEGDPALRPGRVLTVEGVAPAIDGRFVVTEAVHLLSDIRGYVTEFSTAPPPRPARQRQPAFTIGTVCDLDDPDALARLRAVLPGFGGIETDWMPVVIPGAGPGRGAAMLPEPGDEVFLVFPDGDPARGLVLGGLYGEHGIAWGEPADNQGGRAYVLHSPGGQSLTLDGRQPLARLGTSAGDLLELGPEGSRLHASRDLVIEAPGRTLTIRAKAIAFEEG